MYISCLTPGHHSKTVLALKGFPHAKEELIYQAFSNGGHGPNPACRPYLFDPLSAPIYIEIHRTMVIIWPSHIFELSSALCGPQEKVLENLCHKYRNVSFNLKKKKKCVLAKYLRHAYVLNIQMNKKIKISILHSAQSARKSCMWGYTQPKISRNQHLCLPNEACFSK